MMGTGQLGKAGVDTVAAENDHENDSNSLVIYDGAYR